MAGGGSQNSAFGANGNNTITGVTISNNYVTVPTLIDLPATLTTLVDGAFAGATNLLTVICRATNVPTTITSGNTAFRAMSGSQKLYVPALSVTDYKTAWNVMFGNFNPATNNTNIIGFYNVTVTGGIAASPLASDIAASTQKVNITATTIPGKVFKQWKVISENVTLNDATAESTFFTMPAGNVSIEVEYETPITWTGDTDTDWNTASNWDSNTVPAASDNVVIPSTAIITLSADGAANTLTIQKGASITLGENTKIAANSVKVEYGAITEEKWYSIGFPFDVTTVYSEDFTQDLTAYTAATGGNYWLKNIDDNEDDLFDYATDIEGGEGYIIQFPAGFSGTEISFIGIGDGSAIDLTAGSLNEEAFVGTYQLKANPTLAPYSPTLGAKQHIYKYSTGNEFLLDDNYTIAPFEAVVTISSSSPAPKISLDTDVVTGVTIVVENDAVMATQYYNLQGQRILQPQKGTVVLVKKIYESGKSIVGKIINK
ncbi:hypothetical protein FACS189463_1140 [Bacteroidia bacterium]|nr:hypothetical protein FACS189463_1140 [Bacteroidia bacterium]